MKLAGLLPKHMCSDKARWSSCQQTCCHNSTLLARDIVRSCILRSVCLSCMSIPGMVAEGRPPGCRNALEDPWEEPDESMFTRSVSPEQAPDTPTYVEINFHQGDPVAINGKDLSPATLLTALNTVCPNCQLSCDAPPSADLAICCRWPAAVV